MDKKYLMSGLAKDLSSRHEFKLQEITLGDDRVDTAVLAMSSSFALSDLMQFWSLWNAFTFPYLVLQY